MDFIKQPQPRFHQVAIASALTLSVLSPATWADRCAVFPAEPLTVNITSESDDFCDEQVSLREAITYANEQLGKDTVTFADSLKGQTIEASNGQINITESLVITGPTDAELITLKASDSAELFFIQSSTGRIDFDLENAILEKVDGTDHIIEMNGYGGDIILDNIQTTDATRAYGIFDGYAISSDNSDLNLTLKNSTLSGSAFSDDTLEVSNVRGGDAQITIQDSKILGIEARQIADVYSDDEESKASIKIQRSQITGSTLSNIADSYSYYGTAEVDITESSISNNTTRNIIQSSSYYGSASTNISDSTISGNTISDTAVATFGKDSSQIIVVDSSLCDNLDVDYDGYGGEFLGNSALIEIGSRSDLKISNSELCNNQQQAVHINSWNEGDSTATIENTIISNNSNIENGAGIYARTSNNLDLSIINSSITSNRSQGHGGGIYIETRDESEISLKINNSTISDNHAGYELNDERISEGTGGGLYTYSVSGSTLFVDISGSTINGNIANGLGGGVVNMSDNTDINIQNSIIANNTAGTGTEQDLFGTFTVQNSLIRDTSAFGGKGSSTINGTLINQIGDDEGQTPDTGNNILGQDPLLQELTLSGGTWVHPLSVNSPAIAAGNADTENLAEFDQRGQGFARVRNVNGTAELDMGAVQYFANPVAVNDAITVGQDSENNRIDVLVNDAQSSDGLPLDADTITIITQPENGDVEVLTDGSIVYSPKAEFTGTDSFTYVVQDIGGNTSTEASVTITVNEETIPDDRSNENSAPHKSGGGTLNYWLLSLLGLCGLRRKLK